MARFNKANNVTELRMHIGDDITPSSTQYNNPVADYFSIGSISPIDNTWNEIFKVGSDGSVNIGKFYRTGADYSAGKALYFTGPIGDSSGVEFRKSDETQGIGIGYNSIYATGSSTDQNVNIKPKGAGIVSIPSDLTVTGTISALDLRYGASNNSVSSKIQSLDSSVSSNNSSISTLNTSVTSINSSLSTMNTTLSSHTTSINTLNTTTSSHSSSITSINNSITSINSSLTPLNAFASYTPSSFILKQAGNSLYVYTVYGNTLYSYGVVYGTMFSSTSDKRLKKEITPLKNSLDKINKIQGYSYIRKGAKEKEVGLIAQNVEKVFPELVFEMKEGPSHSKGMKSVAYSNLIAPVIEAIKELYGKCSSHFKDFKSYKNRVQKLEAQNKKLEERIARLEKMLQRKIKGAKEKKIREKT